MRRRAAAGAGEDTVQPLRLRGLGTKVPPCAQAEPRTLHINTTRLHPTPTKLPACLVLAARQGGVGGRQRPPCRHATQPFHTSPHPPRARKQNVHEVLPHNLKPALLPVTRRVLFLEVSLHGCCCAVQLLRRLHQVALGGGGGAAASAATATGPRDTGGRRGLSRLRARAITAVGAKGANGSQRYDTLRCRAWGGVGTVLVGKTGWAVYRRDELGRGTIPLGAFASLSSNGMEPPFPLPLPAQASPWRAQAAVAPPAPPP